MKILHMKTSCRLVRGPMCAARHSCQHYNIKISFSALPVVAANRLYSISLPNKLNISFNYHNFLILYMLGYLPYLPKLYKHMLSQRNKVLFKETEKKSA